MHTKQSYHRQTWSIIEAYSLEESYLKFESFMMNSSRENHIYPKQFQTNEHLI